MASLFCCSQIEPYRPRVLDHESKFQKFMSWAQTEGKAKYETSDISSQVMSQSLYAVQLVCQINHGPQDWIRYFVPKVDAGFHEVKGSDLIEAKFQKVNNYKNFRCSTHNRFFEVNIHHKDPINRHHWRSTLARPGTDIKLPREGTVSTVHETAKESSNSPNSNEKIDIQFVRSCLRIAFEPLAEKFTGGLLSLTTFDLLSNRFDAKVDLTALWEENIVPLKIVNFILELQCRDKRQNPRFFIDTEKVKQTLLGAAHTAVESRETGPKRSRHDLVKVLHSMTLETDLDRCSLELLQACIQFTESGPKMDITPGIRTRSRQSTRSDTGQPPDSPDTGSGIFNLHSTLSGYDDDDCLSYKDYAACSLEDCGYCGHCYY